MIEKIKITKIIDRGPHLILSFQIVDTDKNDALLYAEDRQITADKQDNLEYLKSVGLMVFENYENKEANKRFLEGKIGQYFTKAQLE